MMLDDAKKVEDSIQFYLYRAFYNKKKMSLGVIQRQKPGA